MIQNTAGYLDGAARIPRENEDVPTRTVLIIAYYFPPMGLSGVQRILKFVKYLPEFGWKPIVLTVGDVPYYAMDESLLDELKPLIERGEVEIIRTEASGTPAKLAAKSGNKLKLPSALWQRLRSKIIQTVMQPDSRIGWKNHALKTATAIYESHKIDAIMATAPPFTDFLIARELRKKYGTPFLMDYRDAWVENPVLNFYATPFHKAYAAKMEDDCLRASDAVTVVNRSMKEILLRNYAFLRHEDVTILPHGYDADDFEQALIYKHEYEAPHKFRLTYSGAFYVKRSPKVMFQAVQLAMKKEPNLAADLELVFAGVLQKEYRKMSAQFGLEKNVLELGYLDHVRSVALLMASDVLWMTMSDDLSAPGKLYEYIGSRRPILGLVPPGGNADRLLKEYGAARTAAPDDVEATADHILKLYQQWRKGTLAESKNDEFIESFDRRQLSWELARHLAHLTHAVV